MSGLYNTLDMSGDYGGVLLMPVLMTWFSTESVLATGGLLTVLFCAGAFLLGGARPDKAELAAGD